MKKARRVVGPSAAQGMLLPDFYGAQTEVSVPRMGSGGFAEDVAVAEHFDVVVGGFDVAVLAAHDVLGGAVQRRAFNGVAIGGHGGVFTAFGFLQDDARLVGREGNLEVGPTAMDAAGERAGGLGVGSEGDDTGLEFGGEFGALFSVAFEVAGEFGDFDVFGGRLETLLAVFEDFDEVVEGLDSGFDVGVHG